MMSSNQQDLSGKIAVVTGAGRGLGAAIADVLADRGAHVIVNDRTLEPATEAVEKIRGEAAAPAPSLLMWLIRPRWRTLSGNFSRTMVGSTS
jgi:NAD(P)-dependent dehydrogenase (short-subunit alcohol dehydrogenase family)